MANGKLIFFGTSEICVPYLEMLHRHFELPLIVATPDVYGGRNRKKLIVPPVKMFALENGIECLQPEDLKDPEFMERVRSLEADLGVVIAYGKFIPASVFKIPPHRMLNVHFSMLPLYRGAAPVQRAIENGDAVTGVSIFQLVRKMDAGDLWAQKEFPIGAEDTTISLWNTLSRQGAPFLNETVENILAGKIEPTPQDHEKATYAPPIKKEESKADWQLTAQQLFDRFRAFTPWPGLCCDANDKRFKLTKLRVSELTHEQTAGTILSMDKKNLKICCGGGTVLEILEMQPPGKKPMTPFCYCQGNELPEALS